MSVLHFWYIHDIFMILKGIKAGLLTFIKELNEQHKTIQFDCYISSRKTSLIYKKLCKEKK